MPPPARKQSAAKPVPADAAASQTGMCGASMAKSRAATAVPGEAAGTAAKPKSSASTPAVSGSRRRAASIDR